MLKALWYEIFIFDQSDGEKLRQVNFRQEYYDDFFKNLRFDDKTPYAQFQKLLKWKDLPESSRRHNISTATWARSLSIRPSYGEHDGEDLFNSIYDDGSSDETFDEEDSASSCYSYSRSSSRARSELSDSDIAEMRKQRHWLETTNHSTPNHTKI